MFRFTGDERSLRRLVVVAIALALLIGCYGGEKPAPPGYLTVAIDSTPISLDPRLATDALSTRISELMYDALVRIDERGRFVGNLAETIEQRSPTELIFRLRQGLKFSDGRPLTSKDVQYTFESVIAPGSLSPKRGGLEVLESVRALDDQTIKMTFKRPYAPALEVAMLEIVPYGSPPVSKRYALPPPGSGLFRLRALVRDEKIELARNPFHVSPARLAGVYFKIVPDPTVRALELAKGSADFAENNIQPDLLSYLTRRRNLNVELFAGTGYQYLEFNMRDPKLRDVRVRRAIAMAIDREGIIRTILRGTARVATGMLSPENWAYESSVSTYAYNPEASRNLLDDAGYVSKDGAPRFTLVFKTTPDEQRRRLAQAIQAMLGAVGIRVEIRTNEWATFYSDIQRGNFDLTTMAWIGINDPHHYFMIFDSKMTPPHGQNRGFYSNPEMDLLVEGGDRVMDAQARRRIYGKVQKLAALDLPYVSLWWLDNVAVMNREVMGFRHYPNGSLLSFEGLTFENRMATVAPSQ